jgi:hypothetical protein
MAEFEYHNAGNSEAQEKEALTHLFAPSGTAGIAATGVIDGLVVVQATTPNGTVLISFGVAVVQSSVLNGASLLANDTAKTLDIFTANPMGGLPRNDIVVFDSITASIIAITGTPNATPTDPTVPATAVALARLRNLASATTIPTAQIDTLIVNTALRGVKAVPIVYTDAGVALTSVTVNTFTTAVRSVSDPFGAGVPYRCKVTYYLGIVGAAAGITGRAWINVGGTGTSYALVSAVSSAAPSLVKDMPAGGTTSFQAVLANLTGAMSTYLDAAAHFMVTEVSPL